MNMLEIEFESYERSVPDLLDRLGAATTLAGQSRVLIKPNLINASPPPVTTPVACCAEIVRYVRSHSGAEVVIGEGCGDARMETGDVFERLGYVAMARDRVELQAPRVKACIESGASAGESPPVSPEPE